MANETQRIDYLVETLNNASAAYYGGKEEIMSNFEWDALFDELAELESRTGYIRDDSPTQSTSSSQKTDAESGTEEPHEFPALSLAKTKKIEELQQWAGDRDIWLSWKLDGITLVVTYDNGVPVKILSRGDGRVGKNLNHLIGFIKGIPNCIQYKGHMVVRGEATISYDDFERINEELADGETEYANPRNLVSGTISLDKNNASVIKNRSVTFNAFTLVYVDFPLISWGERLDFLDQQGFITVEREHTNASKLPSAIKRWTLTVENKKMPIPVDGLVINYDDTDYASTGSVTGHHATRGGLAYKWADTSATTTLKEIEWSCSVSTITPVAIFDPVMLEGTTVTRASLCNISELDRLGIGENGKTVIEIIKANKIIPKCVRVIQKEGKYTVPSHCPVCHAPTEQVQNGKSGTITLKCTNTQCPAKHLKRFARFVSKEGMDIDGLSTERLKSFINKGFLERFSDIYQLHEHQNEIIQMEGFGDKSCENLLSAIEAKKHTSPVKFIYSLSIPLIGIDAATKIINTLGSSEFEKRVESGGSFEDIDGIGIERSNAIQNWFRDPINKREYDKLKEILDIEKIEQSFVGGRCNGLSFVITGEVTGPFKNRNEIKNYIQQEGGAVKGSVSKKTDYLINNDINSTSEKNEAAKKLGVKIISVDEFIRLFG
ncbi:MAG: NAD-dependent DNA ligase LigA [Oscillospiraceae bacterium]|nr:NAD-dependent DNA ligase LigA [Oscillospiraceae bacterium]